MHNFRKIASGVYIFVLSLCLKPDVMTLSGFFLEPTHIFDIDMAVSVKEHLFFFLRFVFAAVMAVGAVPHAGAEAFRYLTRDDGLAHNRYYEVCEDGDGFIWLYSHHGVDRYDGNIIVHYDIPTSFPVLSDNETYVRMACGADGVVHISMKNGEIFRYDRETDRLVLVTEVNAGGSLLGFLPDDGLFCTSGGLFVEKDGGFVMAALKGTPVYDIVRYEENSWIAATSGGLFYVRRIGDGFEERELASEFSGSIMKLALTCGKVYIGTFSGLYVYEFGKRALKKVDSVPSISICGFARASDKELVVAADGGGLYFIETGSGKLVNHYGESTGMTAGMLSNSVSDVCCDHIGRIWAVSPDGVCFLDPEALKIRWAGQPSEQHPHGCHVNRMLQDSNGDLWLGSNEGVSFMKKGYSALTDMTPDDGLPHVVLSLAEDSMGNIWAGGYSMKVYRLSMKTGKADILPSYKENGSFGAPSEFIYSLLNDGRYMWMGGIEGFLARYDCISGRYEYFDKILVGDMIRYSDDKIVAASVGGLAVIDRTAGQIRVISEFGGVSLTGPIRKVIKASDGKLWLATDGSGLISYDMETGRSCQYAVSDGLSSMSVNNVVEDGMRRIWTTTEDGIYWIDEMSGSLKNARAYLAIPECFFNDRAAICLDDGTLGFGTTSGVFFFHPDVRTLKIQENCRLYFYGFRVRGTSGKTELSAVRALQGGKKVVLPYRNNSFSVAFSALSDFSGGGLSFSWRMGNQAEWCASPEDNVLIFNDISRGNHTLYVRASDKFTGQVLAESSVLFRIKSPWWLSGWAFIAYSALAVLFCYMAFRYYMQKENEARFQDKIRLFTGLAHDIRTPLNLIKSPLSEIAASVNLPVEYKDRLETASRNVDRISEMVSRLLSLQKTEAGAGAQSPVEIRAYIEGRVAEFLPAARKKSLELTFEVKPSVPKFIMADVSRLDHVMQNLLSNAVKYTEKGSVKVSVASGASEWNIMVYDTGRGIPKGEQSRIFNDFFRAWNVASADEGGFGIGLVVTRRFVRQMKGDISFVSEEGKGSVFTVSLPMEVYEEPAPCCQESVPDKVDETQVRARLLLVEDDTEFREYLCRVLSEEYDVSAAGNGQQALDAVRNDNPDIVVSDIMMPVMRGDDLCRILKNDMETSHIPVILLSALDDKESIILGLESGANDYVVKPFDISVLKLRIRNILKSRDDLRHRLLSGGKSTPEENYTNILDKKFMDTILSIMESELGNSAFSVEEIGPRIGMSRTSLYNKLKALTGESPVSLLRIMRLNKAKELLEKHESSITDVAVAVGFSDAKYFGTCFKKQFGISPGKLQNGGHN